MSHTELEPDAFDDGDAVLDPSKFSCRGWYKPISVPARVVYKTSGSNIQSCMPVLLLCYCYTLLL